MALSVSLSRDNGAQALVNVTSPSGTAWHVIEFPDWVRGVQVINHGGDTLFLSSDVADEASGSGGVPVPAGGSYTFVGDPGRPTTPYLAVRHASGSYAFGLAMWSQQ
jgi:hypothetical protein